MHSVGEVCSEPGTCRIRSRSGRNLTFQAGLRDEFTTGWNEKSGRASNYITGPDGVLLTTPLVGDSVYAKNNATHLFSPRVGLAWDPFGNQKTSFRAGFGTYYSLIDALNFLLNSLPPYNGSAAFTGSLPSLLPITPNVPVPPSCGPTILTSCTIYAPQGVQPDAKTQAVEEWNASVEQQLSRNMSLRVAYVGSHGYHFRLSASTPIPSRRKFARMPAAAPRAASAPPSRPCLKGRNMFP